jgi:outer membrane protein
MDWQQAKDNLTIRIILAYLQVLSNEDLLAQSNNQAAVSNKEIERLDILNKEGAIQPSNLSDLKGQFANDQLSIINTQNSLETAKIDLCQLMNIPYDKSMQLERISAEAYLTKYEQTPDSIYQVALQQFSLIRATDLRRQSAERAVKVARGQLYPTLSLNGNIGTAYSSTFLNSTNLGTSQNITSNSNYVLVNGVPSPVITKVPDYSFEKIPFGDQFNNNRASSIGLSLRVPIFNSLQTRNRVKLAKLDFKNNELIAQTSKTQLQQSIEQAYSNMTAASDRYKVLLDQVAAYAESFRAAEIRFNAGLGTSVDYLTAKNNLDRSNINVITEKYNYILRTKILDYYQGKLLW